MKKIVLGVLGTIGILVALVVISGVISFNFTDGGDILPGPNLPNAPNVNDGDGEVDGALKEAEARIIAEQTCIKGGESLSTGQYNEGTKTWWYDANLNAAKPGCNPACVVDEKTKTAEINWRCTGLIMPTEPVACTMDAMQCPDGSYVGRSGPNCVFVCP